MESTQSPTSAGEIVAIRLVSLLGASLLAVLTHLLSASPQAADPVLKLDPALPYQAEKSNPITYEFEYSITVTAPAQTKKLQVWIPQPKTDAGQVVDLGPISTFPVVAKPTLATEPVFGNQFAYLEIDQPEGALVIRQPFKVTVWELRWNLDPARVERVEKWPAGFAPYLRSDRAVVVNDRFGQLAREIVGKPRGPADDLAQVMAWLDQNMTYDSARSTLKASSEYALDKRVGNCSEYHGLCAAFGRSLGLPTRMTYGLNTFPKSSPSHCKLEAFLPPYGWVVFDVSETQKLIRSIQQAKDLSAERKQTLVQAALTRLRQGFRDNTWFVHTRGTDYELAPKASQRVSVVRTIYAEADGKPLPDPDPSNPANREFAWMTAIAIKADKPVSYPYKGWSSLEK
jgi:transglutaminase-like putative cysteine protease